MFVTRVARRVPLVVVEHKLLTLPGVTDFTPVCNGVHVRSLVFCVLFFRLLFVLCPFSFAIVSSKSSYIKTSTCCHSTLVEASRMGNIKDKDEMDLIDMLIDLTGIRNITEQDEIDIGTM
jgi:hypothetical protein